jgi:UDP-N-acetyl-D-mannosaminuronate dehydrogenase
MRLTNDCYLVTLRFASGVEHYFRDGERWTKVTTRGNRMPATAEQVMNHLLPALAGVKPGIDVSVAHCDVDVDAGETLKRLRGNEFPAVGG